MAVEMGAGPPPFHDGELEVQARIGVSGPASRVGRTISPILTEPVARLMADHRLAVAASVDEESWVWASLLTGPRGFLRPVDERLMLIESHPHPFDPLRRNLEKRRELGILAIDLTHRRRLRFNGAGLPDRERGIFLAVDQVYGNCPKYIRPRLIEAVERGTEGEAPERSPELSDRQRAWIARADTLFIASYHPGGGADASHRGGPPGFVSIVERRALAFTDYPGNNMFNTLGNLQVWPRAGLLFLDFQTGATLQLRGSTRLDWSPDRPAEFREATGARVIFEIEEALETGGAGVRGRLLEAATDDPGTSAGRTGRR